MVFESIEFLKTYSKILLFFEKHPYYILKHYEFPDDFVLSDFVKCCICGIPRNRYNEDPKDLSSAIIKHL
jgi:hypothetical protein